MTNDQRRKTRQERRERMKEAVAIPSLEPVPPSPFGSAAVTVLTRVLPTSPLVTVVW